jgi:hypothetical protein
MRLGEAAPHWSGRRQTSSSPKCCPTLSVLSTTPDTDLQGPKRPPVCCTEVARMGTRKPPTRWRALRVAKVQGVSRVGPQEQTMERGVPEPE